MSAGLKENLSRGETWRRVLFVILFGLIYTVAEIVVVAVVVLQFGFVLVTGSRNALLLDFGAGLSEYVYQILRYVTLTGEIKPFPFAPWPEAGSHEAPPRSDDADRSET